MPHGPAPHTEHVSLNSFAVSGKPIRRTDATRLSISCPSLLMLPDPAGPLQ